MKPFGEAKCSQNQQMFEYTDQSQSHQEETHHPTHRFRRLFIDLRHMGWKEFAGTMGVIKLSSASSGSKTFYVFNLYIAIYAVEEYLVSIISDSVNVLSLQLNVFAVDRCSTITRIHNWSVMIYGSLQAEFIDITHNDYIHGTPFVGNIVVHASKLINKW